MHSSSDPVTSVAGGALLPANPPQFRRFMSGSRPIDLDGIDWDAIPDHPLADDILRILTYMQDVESHTVVFPRTFFSKCALEDEHVGPILICWLYEEGMHGRALAKFLDCAGHPVPPRTRERTTLRDRVDRTVTRMMSAAWKDFLLHREARTRLCRLLLRARRRGLRRVAAAAAVASVRPAPYLGALAFNAIA